MADWNLRAARAHISSCGHLWRDGYSVAQRTREIGIRIALGAQQGNVLKLIVAQGARLALIGVLVGLAGAFALTRLMASLLYESALTDFSTFPWCRFWFCFSHCAGQLHSGATRNPGGPGGGACRYE